MKIDPIRSKEDGRILAFTVKNKRIGRKGFCRIVNTIPGATVIRKPKKILSWFREDIFCVFEVNGSRFEAEELYGDSDEYWIGPEGTGIEGKELVWLPAIETVVAAFERV